MLATMRAPLLVALSLAAVGCPARPSGGADAPKPPAAPPAPKPPTETAPTKTPVATGSCAAPWTDHGPKRTGKLGEWSFEAQGTRWSGRSDAEHGRLVIGALADVEEATPENLENLRRALAWFQRSEARLIVALGDLGDDAATIAKVLRATASAGVPVLALPGNQEGRGAWRAAMVELADVPEIVDLTAVRLVELGDVAFVSLPGYHDPRYVHAGDACVYSTEDVEGLEEIFGASKAAHRVILAHGPPQQAGRTGLDYTLEHVNVGDVRLDQALKRAQVPFGLFANIREAGGRATDARGLAVVPAGARSPSLYVNVGAIDAVRWEMNEGPESTGMASIVSLSGGQAYFEVERFPAPAAAAVP